MGDRDVHVGEPASLGPRSDLAVQEHLGPPATAWHDLDVGPAHALPDSGAEGLQHRFLRGEAAGEVLVRPALPEAVVLLAPGEQDVDDPGVLSYEPLDAADSDDVHANPETQTRNLPNLRALRPCPPGSGP